VNQTLFDQETSGIMSINNNRQVLSLITSITLFFSLAGNANAVICLELGKTVPEPLSSETLKCQSTQTQCCESMLNVEEQKSRQSTDDCEECFDLSTSPSALAWSQDREEHQDVSPILNDLCRNEVLSAFNAPQRNIFLLNQAPQKTYLLQTLQTTVLLI
jgi:hypothetical protein